MATITEIRVGIAEALKTIPGIDAFPYMKSSPVVPAAHVFPDEIDYDQSMGRGHDDVFLTVQAFVGVTDDQGAQQRLDRMLAPAGEESIKAAIEADRTLGGLVDSLQVESCTGYRTYGRGPNVPPVLGAEWRVRVLAGL